MHNVVGELLQISVIVVCGTGWACCDELTRRQHSLIVSIVDVSVTKLTASWNFV